MTRAKFQCVSSRKYKSWNNKDGFMYEFEFNVVMDGSPENKLFFASTPAGNIKLSVVSEDLFEVGKEYYVNFTEPEAG